MNLKTTKIIYWVSTGIIVLVMGASAVLQLVQTSPEFKAEITMLGYPFSFLRLLGLSKILGVIALLVPGFPKLREWAYAGFVFTLIGAVYAHFAVGIYKTPQAVILVILFLSYFTNRKTGEASINVQPG